VPDTPSWNTNGLSEEELVPMLRQMLRGLCALHDADLVHGDIRAANVTFDPDGPPCRTAWLTGVPTGRIAEWTGNALMPRNPPRKPNGQAAPKKADLYGVGLVALELLLGSGHVPPKIGPLAKLLKKRQKQVGRSTRKALRQLLEDKPVTARDVLETLDRPQTPWRSWVPVVLGVVLATAVVGLYLAETRRGRQLDKLVASTAKVESTLGDLTGQIEDVRQRNQAIQDHLNTNNTRLKDVHRIVSRGAPPAPPEELAKQGWTIALSGRENSTAEQMVDRIRKYIGTIDDEKVEKWARKWEGKFNKVLLESKNWESERGLQERARAFIREPWDETKKESFERHLTALTEAKDLWNKWATRPDMTRGELESEIARRDKEKEVLNRWYDDLKEFEPTLFLKAAKAPEGYGTTREIGVWTDTQGWKWFGAHDWKKPTEATYSAGTLPFRWKPGDRVQINLEGERSWMTGTRPNHIEHQFKGPLALWLAAREGRVSGNGFTLEYEIRGQLGAKKDQPCPGPPSKDVGSDLPM